jgi:CubicO group peptidase (beta-lactamase class C family)
MRGLAAGGLATALRGLSGFDHDRVAAHQDAATPVATPVLPATLSDATLRAFEADVEAALQTFRVPGAAVALVQGNEIIFNRGFSVRDLASGDPVTPRTRFRHGSLTKAVTTTLLASLVDEGIVRWDDRAADLWPAFRAPTPELTQDLRLRDLLGMGSGIAESTTVDLSVVEFFMMAGLLSAADVLRSVADLPVIAPPNTTFSYNNTLYAVAAYLGQLALGTPSETLEEAYVTEVRRRVFEPIGMADAAILDDPRPLGTDFAVGYARDIFGNHTPLPFVSLGGVAPAGSGLTSGTDLARFLIAQMNGGVAPDGTRVVSAANIAETHRPGIDANSLAPPPEIRPDAVSLHYAMGWLVDEYRDGRRSVWHAGGIDGFDSLMGFFPDEKVGFAIQTNADDGSFFFLSVQASLLSRLFGLNRGVPALIASFAPMLEARAAESGEQARPADPAVAAAYLGLYEDGFLVRLDEADGLRLHHGIRSLPLMALAGGGYIVASGPAAIAGHPVAFDIGSDAVPNMTIQGFAPVRWLTGG